MMKIEFFWKDEDRDKIVNNILSFLKGRVDFHTVGINWPRMGYFLRGAIKIDFRKNLGFWPNQGGHSASE